MHWIFKNKDQGKTAATASLGLVTLWDVEGGLPQIDKFLYSKDNYVVAGLTHVHTSAACLRLMRLMCRLSCQTPLCCMTLLSLHRRGWLSKDCLMRMQVCSCQKAHDGD